MTRNPKIARTPYNQPQRTSRRLRQSVVVAPRNTTKCFIAFKHTQSVNYAESTRPSATPHRFGAKYPEQRKKCVK
ncbi:hypothetical protein PPTG_20939 [Phytophthora nicotianae INRA-310]|uniref:Uncharacterized protein n=1 Tax=Phytophthora nicotianae (strain INRA-310) TaxID=761204 RepID=W2RCZ5_PHYN3|nr:hypothetical protein PPTG_20939 [Phytophthora nicotianae INRA-310]ETN22554.1 hypothetical protein PPTG_20939 [Phytophthora nicotianae INRA-310]